MSRLNILLVAPDHPDLPNVAAEVAAIRQNHDVVALLGPVRDPDIARAVQNGPYDIIWFASHGNEDGVLLSDGLLPIDGVGQYARHAALCVLNTCSSENVAISIISGGDTDMICTIGDVRDTDAQRFGILLSGELTRHDDFHDAYLRARPEGGKYRYYRAGPSAPVRRYHDNDVLRDIQDRLIRIETRLEYELPQIKTDIKNAGAMPLWMRILVFGVSVIVGVLFGALLTGFV